MTKKKSPHIFGTCKLLYCVSVKKILKLWNKKKDDSQKSNLFTMIINLLLKPVLYQWCELIQCMRNCESDTFFLALKFKSTIQWVVESF